MVDTFMTVAMGIGFSAGIAITLTLIAIMAGKIRV